MFLCCRVRMLFWGLDSESKLSNHCSPAHPLERVVVLAPGPLYGRSPRHLTSQVFALDSPVLARPSLGLLLLLETITTVLDDISPRGTFCTLDFAPGGSEGWKLFVVGVTNM